MRIETYGQKDLFLFQIADMERQIDAHVAMRDHVADSGKLSAEMDALFASILTPLCEGVAARKAALDALTTADHLRLAEEEQERTSRRPPQRRRKRSKQRLPSFAANSYGKGVFASLWPPAPKQRGL
jgi:hypothetical protein